MIRLANFFKALFSVILMLPLATDVALAQDLIGECTLPGSLSASLLSKSRLPTVSSVPGPGFADRFPSTGTINALIVFVQHQNDVYEDCREFTGYSAFGVPQFTTAGLNYATDCAGRPNDSWTIGGFQSWTDDQTSEWPLSLPVGPDPLRTRELPEWAEDLIDPPGSTTFTAGSLSDLYNRMSNGVFTLTGEVWDYVYIPEQTPAWYDINRGPYNNGAIRLSQEIVTYVDANPHGIDFTDTNWDQYDNGDGDNFTSDGNFDMIILVYRFSSLTTMASVANSAPGQGFSGSASNVTSLGSQTNSATADDLSPGTIPTLELGSYDVIDNIRSGSGVLTNALTRKSALRIIAHEIGHRQFGLYHTDDVDAEGSENMNLMSIMNGSPHASFSGGDRAKINWANIQFVDASAIGGNQNFTLRDAAVVNNTETDLIWFRNGAADSCGDLIVESRMQSSFWDNPTGVGNEDDGDGADFYLPNEGLYIEKASDNTTCGFTGPDNEISHSGIPNGGLTDRRTFFGADANNPDGMYTPGFGPGDVYSPFTSAAYNFHNSAFDDNVALTNISITGNSISFDVWSDFLIEQSAQTKEVTTFYEFVDDNIGQNSTWTLDGDFEFENDATIADNAVINVIAGGSITFPGASVVLASGTNTSGVEFNGGDLEIFSSNAHFSNTNFDVDSFTIRNGADVTIANENGFRIESNFLAEPGSALLITHTPIASQASPQIKPELVLDDGEDSIVDAREEKVGENASRALLDEGIAAEAYPNPFNPTVRIRYNLEAEGHVVLKIYNMLGQEVKALVSEFQPVGSWESIWDGRNNAGSSAPSGAYMYRLEANGQIQAGQLVLVK